MKTLQNYITEKILINKNSKIGYIYHPKTKDELEDIIKQKIESEGNECNLNDIDTSNITDMSWLFNIEFNGDISKWDVSNVKNMDNMFSYSKFNGDISNWDVSNVTTMDGMFFRSEFNGDISKWDMSNVTDMESMFASSKFNGDISNWDVSNVIDMKYMFKNSNFNGDISKWNVSNVTNNSDIFYNCPIEEKYKPKFKK